VYPWQQIDFESNIGNPAGIIAPGVGIKGDPGILLATNIPDDSCVVHGDEVIVNVSYSYKGTLTLLPVDDCVAEVWLAEHLDFVSATGTYVYTDSHTVVWDIGTMVVGDSAFQQIYTEVSDDAAWLEVLSLRTQIRSELPPDLWDEVFASVTVCEEPPYEWVELDIKPTSCPNPLNVRVLNNPGHGGQAKKGPVLPVAILGTDMLDVNDIDVSTLLLEGVAPIRYDYEDVAAPLVDGDSCDCTTAGPDQHMDLTLKFKRADIVAALGTVSNGEFIPLTLAGQLLNGTDILGEDCVRIIGPRSDPPSSADDQDMHLSYASPNPFNPRTRIAYSLPANGFVKLSIYDVTGRLIERLVQTEQPAGEHVVEWDAKALPSGIYFYRLEVGQISETRKMILLK
jgi:hypothetical protein